MQAALARKAAAFKDVARASWRTTRSVWSNFGREQGLRVIYEHLRARQPAAALQLLRKSCKTCTPEATEDVIRLFGAYSNARQSMLEAVKTYVAAGFRPSSKTWASLLRSVTDLEDADLLKLVDTAGPGLLTEDLVAAVMRVHSKNGRPDLCEAVFERYEQELEGTGRYPGPLVWKCLIDARGYYGDIEGAKAWFDVWRTSRAHPYGFLEEEQEQPIVHRRPTQALPTSQGLLRAGPTFSEVLQGSVGRYSRTASTISELPAPDPRPYAAFLRHIVHSSRHIHMSLSWIELMAADRVPTTRCVLNSLIYHEAAREESRAPASMMAIYHKMHTSTSIDSRPDYKTFTMLFAHVYREPPIAGFPFTEGKPTKLHLQSGLPDPSFSYLCDPRALTGDMLLYARIGPLDIGKPVVLDITLMNTALSAFVRCRDFVGAAALLQAYGRFNCEPDSATHAAVLANISRAHKIRQAFQTVQGRLWYSERQVHLNARLESLNHLSGFSRGDATHVVEISPLLSPGQYVISRPKSRDSDPRVWNGRIIPRKEGRIRATRKYELRDLTGLKQALHMASAFAAEPQKVWDKRVEAASKEMHLLDEIW